MPQKKSQKNNFDLEKYRQDVITALAVLKADNRNVKDTLIELRSLLREQNGRVRKTETAIGWMQGIASVAFAIFSGFIAWLFNK